MYYEDENNLYHYSYRKGDKTVVEPVFNTRNLAEEPADEPPKKKRRWAGLVALMLVCALIGGLVGAGASGSLAARMGGSTRQTTDAAVSNAGVTEIEVSDRETVEVQTVAVTGAKALTFPELYKANINSVVSINTTITTNVFNQTVNSASAGSGFIITADGYIVTNYHVIESANNVKVTLYDGREFDAKIIGGDADYDVAVLKIDATGLQAVTLGNSANLQIGESIAAIGNPLGELTFSMSEGIVSCVDREINVDGTPFNMIQVTAAINPGNSGGPLFNTYGEVVGIVSAKYSAYANTVAEGLGFAIPINDVIAMVEDIMENGRVTNRPYFAITVENVTARRAQQNGYSVDAGARISSIEAGGAADRAGLKVGDIIVKLGDKDIASLSDLNAAKKSYKAGDTATLTVNRNGREIEAQITFDAMPEQTTQQQQPQQNQPQDGNNYYYYDGSNGYFDPWEFFNQFFGNGYGGYNYGDNYGGSNG
ncbi:MAG: trypsin-like peptidase domain-containing protein [Oscillospiraceae bacterium]|nr:trypsin-like peptidase domain-containing protein [Oscillospiraceae bacterium]